MKKTMIALFVTLMTTQAVASQDLVLEGERWLAKFTGYVCDDGNTPAAGVPQEFANFGVQFTSAAADYSLDNIILKATFVEDQSVCNYSAILFADNANHTVALTQSHAYDPAGTTSCVYGKAILDSFLSFNNYKYLHGRVAIYIPVAQAEAFCSSDVVGLHLQVTGRKQ